MSLVVRQTQKVHEEIADLLDQLRRLQDLQVTVEVRFVTVSDRFFERIGIDFDFNVQDSVGGPNTDNAGLPLLPFGSTLVPQSGLFGGQAGQNQQGQQGGQQGQAAQAGTSQFFTQSPQRELHNRDRYPNGTIVGLTQPGQFANDLDVPFRQGSFEVGVPTFGGFNPNAGVQVGMAVLSDIEAFFFVQAAQGDSRTNLLFAPKVTLFNGQQASVQSGVDWRLLAALAYQESQWNPRALSPNGARGIMMLMPETAATVGVRDAFDPRESILGGARYFLRVLAQIPARIAEPDRTWFAIASYNMGYGHLEDARVITQMKGGNPDKWIEVRENLPLLSDEAWYVRVKNGYARGWEAQYTVDRVRAFANVLEWRATARHQPGALETPAELREFDAADDADEPLAPASAAEPASAPATPGGPAPAVNASPGTSSAGGAAPGK